MGNLILDFFRINFWNVLCFSRLGCFLVGIGNALVGLRFRFRGIYSTLATLMLRFAAICNTC